MLTLPPSNYIYPTGKKIIPCHILTHSNLAFASLPFTSLSYFTLPFPTLSYCTLHQFFKLNYSVLSFPALHINATLCLALTSHTLSCAVQHDPWHATSSSEF